MLGKALFLIDQARQPPMAPKNVGIEDATSLMEAQDPGH